MGFNKLWNDVNAKLTQAVANLGQLSKKAADKTSEAPVIIRKIISNSNKTLSFYISRPYEEVKMKIAKPVMTFAKDRFGEEKVEKAYAAIGRKKVHIGAFTAIVAVWGISILLMGGLSDTGAIAKANNLDKAALNMQAANTEDLMVDSVMFDQSLDTQAAIQTVEPTARQIADMSSPVISGYVINVNGKSFGFFDDSKTPQSIIDEIRLDYSKPSSKNAKIEKVYFKERITVCKVQKPIGSVTEFSNSESVMDTLKNGTAGIELHIVKEGETFWDIAVNNKIPVNDLIQANSKVDSENIKPGDKLNMAVSVPVVDVVVIERAKLAEKIEYKVNYKDDKRIAKGKTKVISKGKTGKKIVDSTFIRVNGKIVEKKVIAEKILSKPVARVVAKGTKSSSYAMASQGNGSASGRFISPMSRGYVSSGYGYRSGGFHNALDIAAPIGTPVYASDGGIVMSASYQGAYGNCIVISHGNGYQTRYAHLNSIYIRAGMRVSKGQKIGASGMTGNSTGPHLHFEIIINGSTINPGPLVGR